MIVFARRVVFLNPLYDTPFNAKRRRCIRPWRHFRYPEGFKNIILFIIHKAIFNDVKHLKRPAFVISTNIVCWERRTKKIKFIPELWKRKKQFLINIQYILLAGIVWFTIHFSSTNLKTIAFPTNVFWRVNIYAINGRVWKILPRTL